MVHPNANLTHKPAALFVPLGLTQDLRSADAVSEGVSRLVWQSLLNEETFSTLELADMRLPTGRTWPFPWPAEWERSC